MFSVHTFLSDLLSVCTENSPGISRARCQKFGFNMEDIEAFSKKLCFTLVAENDVLRFVFHFKFIRTNADFITDY